jgi:uncharacterized OB-fold protein
MSAARTVLSAPYVLAYEYRRSVGPVLGRFLAGLRDGKVLGARTPGGGVVVPPTEHDPATGEPIGELVEVGSSGVVTTWSWVPAPRARHPLKRPFAWALVKLDGATTPMLHAVDAGSVDRIHTGMRVRIRWRAERTDGIGDIECFEPEGA